MKLIKGNSAENLISILEKEGIKISYSSRKARVGPRSDFFKDTSISIERGYEKKYRELKEKKVIIPDSELSMSDKINFADVYYAKYKINSLLELENLEGRVITEKGKLLEVTSVYIPHPR